MFMYFPENYGWSLSVLIALAMGGELGEIDSICCDLRSVSGHPSLAADRAWLSAWRTGAENLADRARTEDLVGDAMSASRKYFRAAGYFLMAERQVAEKDAATLETYKLGLNAFAQGVRCSDRVVEFVSVPFEGAVLPSLFVPADGVESPAPCMIHFDGLDVCKEMIYLMHGYDLAKRGVSLLICDHPGVGEALRLERLFLTPETEVPAGACIDYLETRPDVDPDRIGLIALSLGGYYGPRAAAFEKRLKCCVVWGAIWDLPACQEACLGAGTGSVDLARQFAWVFGLSDPDEVNRMIERFRLEDIAHLIECPMLVVHGELDRQAPEWTARATYEGAINSSRRELKVFRSEEGGAEHCQLDNVTVGTDFMHRWIADVLAEGQAASTSEGAGPQTRRRAHGRDDGGGRSPSSSLPRHGSRRIS